MSERERIHAAHLRCVCGGLWFFALRPGEVSTHECGRFVTTSSNGWDISDPPGKEGPYR